VDPGVPAGGGQQKAHQELRLEAWFVQGMLPVRATSNAGGGVLGMVELGP
jgi:hypothetical protein